jgi:hypothetical protein
MAREARVKLFILKCCFGGLLMSDRIFACLEGLLEAVLIYKTYNQDSGTQVIL